MKRLTITGFLLVALFFGAGIGGVAHAADFQKGAEAYQKGDYQTALGEWKPLAKEGHAVAQYNIGMMHALGRGVPQDFIPAYIWLNVAASSGYEKAKEMRDLFATEMRKEDLATAKKCVASNYKNC